MITGLLTPSINDKMYYPSNVDGIINDDWIIDGTNIPEIFKAFKMKSDLFLKKIQEDINLGIYVIRVPDCITHHPRIRLAQTEHNLFQGYVKIDEFLGKIIKTNDFDNLFIISDHGLKIYQNEFNIKRFLEKKKILFYNCDLSSKILSIFIKILGYFNRNAFETIYFHNIFIKFVKRIKSKTLRKNAKESQNDSANISRFIHFYSNYGGIFLNTNEKHKKEIIKQTLLKSKYVNRVILYDSKTLPDILIKLKEEFLYSVKSSFFIKNRFSSYNHSERGIFIAFGKNIKKGRKKEVSYLDFIPTLLKIYNIKIPTHMKGEVLDILKA